jgi:predicted nucleic acid-binding protein
MECFYYSNVASAIQETVFIYDDHYKLWVGQDEYWWLMKTINPVADTHLNIHQVAENARILEKKVADQEATIKRQTEQLERLQNVVEHVVSKFDQLINIESDKTFAAAIDDLYYGIRSPDKYMWLTEDEDEDDSSSSTTYSDLPPLVPVDKLSLAIPDDISVSTHDSMPPLINQADLNEDSDDSAQARINFSRDLCDNS